MRKIARCGRENGFTVLEVIAVLVILGVMAAVAVTRIVPTASYTLASEADTLKIYLRYVQFRALSDDVSWGMSFTTDSCTLLRDGNTAPYNLPNEASPTHMLANGISFSTVPGNVSFDEWGSPGNSDITINLASGGESRTVMITKNTGFIP